MRLNMPESIFSRSIFSRSIFSPLIVLTLFLLCLLNPAPLQAESAPVPLGFHLHHGDALHMQAARQAGADFGVVVFSWADIEPVPGYFYWERTDSILRAAEFYGVTILARLDRPPSWALTPDGPAPWRVEAYGEFTRRVAERYGERLAGVILWNEPNLALEWNDQTPDPASFVALLRAGYAGVKVAAPDLPALLGGPATSMGDGVNALNDLDFLRQIYALGGGDAFDGLAAHPYGFGRPPQEEPAPERLNFRRLELQRAIMEEFGDGAKPVWITESGWRVSAPDPADAWQVVTPQTQRAYTQEMLAWAGERYPWLRGVALWELNGDQDLYGYNLWHGADDLSLTYQALVATCPQRRDDCGQPAQSAGNGPAQILAPDVAIRLGDRGQLHPHWVHLHRGGENPSLYWQADFFLSPEQAGQPLDLWVETMQIDQPGNQIWLNGHFVGNLLTRSRPDATSTWATQRHPLAGERLRPGLNTIRITAVQRSSVRQYGWWRYENYMFRNLRLLPRQQMQPVLGPWQAQPNPPGWGELTRLRLGAEGSLWAVGNRQGQLWRLDPATGQLVNQAGDRPDLVFRDVAVTAQGILAATPQGLYCFDPIRGVWLPFTDSNLQNRAIHTLLPHPDGGALWVGGEGMLNMGYWVLDIGWEEGNCEGIITRQSPNLRSPNLQLSARPVSVFDLLAQEDEMGGRHYFAATDQGIFTWSTGMRVWAKLPPFPAGAVGARGYLSEPFTARLFAGEGGELVARNQDRLWRWDGRRWSPFGPEQVQGRLVATTGNWVGSFESGLWRADGAGGWSLDASQFQRAEFLDMIAHAGQIYAAGSFGLFTQAGDDPAWQPIPGLPPVVTDLWIDPQEPERWLASTPAGIYRSRDAGQSWSLVSPLWSTFDLAGDSQGRLWVATNDGLYVTDDPSADPIPWQEPAGMNTVFFFRVNPHPTDPAQIWASSWGNNIGASQDGGASFAPIHNGLETLSAIDILWHAVPGQATIATIEGLYRTDDGGASWFKLPGPLMGQTVHALYQGGDGVIWAGAADGLWRSGDYGVTWARAAGMSPVTVHRLGRIPGPGGDPWLWAGSEYEGLWLSRDGGASWHFGGLAGRSVFALAPDPLRAGHWLAATDGGIWGIIIE
jgi:photosystem II stability/assembly factor-like uncharacterized protein